MMKILIADDSLTISTGGAIVPLILKKLGADPVIASSIFLTTATNVASMALLLGLAAVKPTRRQIDG